MSVRKQFQTKLKIKPELKRLLTEARARQVSEDDLKEQRVSFAFGNALGLDRVTKDSLRIASKRIRLQP